MRDTHIILESRGKCHGCAVTPESHLKQIFMTVNVSGGLGRRLLRPVDAYLNISGHNCYSDNYLRSKFPVDIPAIRFLMPYSKH